MHVSPRRYAAESPSPSREQNRSLLQDNQTAPTKLPGRDHTQSPTHNRLQARDQLRQRQPEPAVVESIKTIRATVARLPRSQPLTHSRSSVAPRDPRPNRSLSLPLRSRRRERARPATLASAHS